MPQQFQTLPSFVSIKMQNPVRVKIGRVPRHARHPLILQISTVRFILQIEYDVAVFIQHIRQPID